MCDHAVPAFSVFVYTLATEKDPIAPQRAPAVMPRVVHMEEVADVSACVSYLAFLGTAEDSRQYSGRRQPLSGEQFSKQAAPGLGRRSFHAACLTSLLSPGPASA